ncbi:hypothetical protein ACFPRL_33480 [Pseudoclavibacter helvolus]
MVTGRLDNVIVSGGEKVLLDRVEGIVRQLRGLEGAVVVAAPSEKWGQVPALVVESAAWGPNKGQSGAPAAQSSRNDPTEQGIHDDKSGAVLVDARELTADVRWAEVRAATARGRSGGASGGAGSGVAHPAPRERQARPTRARTHGPHPHLTLGSAYPGAVAAAALAARVSNLWRMLGGW